MLHKLLGLILSAIILSGCAQKNNICISTLDLPPLPMPDSKVADELEPFCTIGKCEYFNNWLNELYLFEAQYKIYRNMKYDTN